jgi:UDP-glucose 4-epimerase
VKNGQRIVLVTGANGFVGRHIAPALVDEGWTVRRAVRRPSGGENEVVIGSIGEATDWSAALTGVEAVVHLAARVHQSHDHNTMELHRSVNTDGTLHLARSAAAAGVRQFIFLSTVLVHGRSNDGRAPFSEKDTPMPRGPYAESKAAAEAGLKALSQQSDMNITVVRPPLIYGHGAKGNFALLTRAVKMGTPLPFAAIRNQRAFLSVENLASFIASRLSKPAEKFEIYLVADAEQVSTPEFVRRLAVAAGKMPVLFPVPQRLLSAALNWGGWSEVRSSLIGSLELDLSKAASTGWRPKVTLDDGLQHALAPTGSEADHDERPRENR